MRRIFLFVGISLSLTVYGIFKYIQNDTRNDRIQDLEYTSEVLENYWELNFQQLELSLISIGNRLIEIEDPQSRLNFLNEALAIYEDELLAIGHLDSLGKVLILTGTQLGDSLPDVGANKFSRRSFKKALTLDHISLGESYYFDNVNDWIMPIRIPIRNKEGKIVSVTTSAIDFELINEQLETFGFKSDVSIHLINNYFGSTQLFYPLERSKYDSLLGKHTIEYHNKEWVRNTNNYNLFNSNHPFDQSRILGVQKRIELINHDLIVYISESVIFDEVLARFRFAFFGYLVLLLASIVLYKFIKSKQNIYLNRISTDRSNLKALFESTTNIIGLFDDKKRLVSYNSAFVQAAKQLDGIDLQENMDILANMKSKDMVDLFSTFLDRVLAGERLEEQVAYPSKSNGTIYFKFNYIPIYNEGVIKGASMFAQDITDIKSYQSKLEDYNINLSRLVEERTEELINKNNQLEKGFQELKSTQQKLIQSEKMASLGLLAAGVGHEINNPLNFIKNGAIAIKMRLSDLNKECLDAVNSYFEIIDEGVNRASKIVLGLSHFSRTGESLDENCDINKIIENCIVILGSKLKANNTQVRVNYNSSSPIVKGNEGKLHQVFMNIISNAEDAIKKEGEISINITESNPYYVITIQDNGQGISDENLSKIGDPFFTTKAPGKGTGLGLFITFLIIEDHHGVIEVDSQKGSGTTFTIKLLKSEYS